MEHQIENGISSSDLHLNHCPICLGPVIDESYLDQCFHKFCYNCIVHWTKVVASKYSVMPTSIKCPICNTESFSVIHGYDGVSFQRNYVNQDARIREVFDFLTEAHKYRLQVYHCQTGGGTFIDDFHIMRYRKLRKYLQESCWIHQRMRRKIQPLTQEEDVEILVHHITGVIYSFRRNEQKGSRFSTNHETRRGNFKGLVSEAASPILAGRTDQFVNELEMFLASGLIIDAYDKAYLKHLGWKFPGFTEDEGGKPLKHTHVVPNLCFFGDDESLNLHFLP